MHVAWGDHAPSASNADLRLLEIFTFEAYRMKHCTAGCTFDAIDDAGAVFNHTVGTSTTNYNMIFKVDNLKLLPRDYDVTVSAKGIANFKSKTGDIEYWIATEQGSTSA